MFRRGTPVLEALEIPREDSQVPVLLDFTSTEIVSGFKGEKRGDHPRFHLIGLGIGSGLFRYNYLPNRPPGTLEEVGVSISFLFKLLAFISLHFMNLASWTVTMVDTKHIICDVKLCRLLAISDPIPDPSSWQPSGSWDGCSPGNLVSIQQMG